MNTKLLKQKILDLAIRGKLTQQLKSDGTARELLEQISSKVSSSSSTLSSPRRRGSPSSSAAKTVIPLDKSEAPFEIPANWEWVRLGDIARVTTGKTPLKTEKKFYDEGTIPWVTSSLTSYDYIDKVNVLITEYAVNQCSLLVYPPGTLVLAMYGEGKTRGQISELMVSATINQACAAIEIFCKEKVFKQFIKYFHNWNYERIREGASGSTQPNLNLNIVQSMMVPLPPLAEQQRIVEKIQEAFAEIDSIENNKELLKTHIKQARQKILDLAIHGKLVPQNKSDEPASVLLERITRDNPHYEKMGLDERRETKDERDSNYKRHSREGGNLLAPISKDEIPFDIPENWVWCRLKDIANYGECDNVEVKRIPETAWILELEDIEKDSGKILHFFSKSERQINGVRHQFEKGDVLYSKLRTYLNKVLVASNDGYCTTEIMPIKTTFISNHYLCMVLRSRYFLDYTAMCGYGVKMPRLSTNDAKNGLIPLPPLAEQSRIVAKIEELFSTLDQMERNLV